MRQRRYPETLPVLASYWLRAVDASGYGRRQWKKLNQLLQQTLCEQLLDDLSRRVIVDLQNRVRQTALLNENLRESSVDGRNVSVPL